MSILKVAQLGHPILRMVAEPINPDMIQSPAFRAICDDLLDTMDEYEGAGLAAPQVHIPIRLVALTIDDEVGPELWINPVLTALTDETISSYEGCLSVEGMRARVARAARIHVRYYDMEANERAYVLQGFPAVVAQHECDHLDGIVYLDRADTRTISFRTEYGKYGPMHEYLEASDDMGAPDETIQDEQDDADILDVDDLIEEFEAQQDPWPELVLEVDPNLPPDMEH